MESWLSANSVEKPLPLRINGSFPRNCSKEWIRRVRNKKTNQACSLDSQRTRDVTRLESQPLGGLQDRDFGFFANPALPRLFRQGPARPWRGKPRPFGQLVRELRDRLTSQGHPPSKSEKNASTIDCAMSY